MSDAYLPADDPYAELLPMRHRAKVNLSFACAAA
jgi:hypothetical protein